ncbi:MMPL family transporter, partial [Saezia sanguinis]|uniref:MMPL family transporter n=2 Tax=Bacteria TaxID=2 RepID=UPI00194EAC00
MPSFTDVTEEHRQAAEAIAQEGRNAGLTVEMSGAIAQTQPETGQAEMIGIGVALIVMIIAFGAIVAAFVPIV